MKNLDSIEEGKEKKKSSADSREDSKNREEIAKLREEKEELAEKTKELAGIIEQMSEREEEPKERIVKVVEPSGVNTAELEKRMNDQFQSQFKDIKDVLSGLGEKMKGMEKSGAAAGDSGVKSVVNKIKEETTERMSSLEQTIKALADKINSQEAIPTRGGEAVSKGLAAFGETMNFHDELIEVRNSTRAIKDELSEFKESVETRITRLRDQSKEIGKLSNIEERVDSLVEKLSPENVEKLRNLVTTSDDLLSRTIPAEIHKKMDVESVNIYRSMAKMKETLDASAKKVGSMDSQFTRMKEQLDGLSKASVKVPELRESEDRMSQSVKEKLTRVIEKVEEYKQETKDALSSFQKNRDEVNAMLSNFSTGKFEEMRDRLNKNLVLAKTQINDMLSRIEKFENYIRPTIDVIKDQMDKFDSRIKRAEEAQEDFHENIEEAFADGMKEKVDPRINEMEKKLLQSVQAGKENTDSLNMRLTQLENVINPTMKMFGNELNKMESRMERFKAEHDEMKEGFGRMKGSMSEMSDDVRSLLQLNDITGKLGDRVEKLEDLKRVIADMREKSDKRKSSIYDEIKAIKKSLGYMETLSKGINENNEYDEKTSQRVGEIEKGLAELRSRFDRVVTQSIDDRRVVLEDSKKQKKMISTILKELKGS